MFCHKLEAMPNEIVWHGGRDIDVTMCAATHAPTNSAFSFDLFAIFRMN